MFKLLALLLGTVVAGVAATAAVVAFAHASTTAVPVQAAPQQLTMQVLDDHDRMLGPNLVVHPGRVQLTIVNYARHSHVFTVPELGIEHVVLPATRSAPTKTTFSFTAPAGVFHWFCALPCDESMSGDIYAVAHPPAIRGALWAAA